MAYLKRTDIKPPNSVEEYHRLMQEDIEELCLDPLSRKLKQDVCKKVSCPLCGENDFQPAYQKSGFTFGRCPRCDFFYVNPRPTSETIARYYRESKASRFFQERLIGPTVQIRVDRIVKPRVEWLNRVCLAKGSLLDVGCSL